MTLGLIAVSLTYLVVGGLLWKIIVVPNYAIADLLNCTNEDELEKLISQRHVFEADEKHSDPVLLIAKASFVVMWPLAIVFGLVTARIF